MADSPAAEAPHPPSIKSESVLPYNATKSINSKIAAFAGRYIADGTENGLPAGRKRSIPNHYI